MRRIITVSSGKGGVGKTTFATNFALTLSRVAPTVLIDLDTGTSSVRNTLDTPIHKDLYHFFRRGDKLQDCLSTLDGSLDPQRLFTNFAFIGAPKHAIDEITNLSDTSRWKLVHAINALPATFIVLDLRAGLDANVIDFLPLSNSGVLVFTPQHPAAILAAGDIVKSLLFRKLRFIFAEGSPFYERYSGERRYQLVNELLDQVEDAYEERLPNLDAFLSDLLGSLGSNPYLEVIADVVHSFGVYFVLNMFSGVEESFENAVLPFGKYLNDHVSSKLRLTNLGWVVEDPKIHEANCQRRPILLQPPTRPRERPVDKVMEELKELETSVLGLPPAAPPRRPRRWEDEIARINSTSTLDRQLEVITRMYHTRGHTQVRDNFAYITHRVLHLIRNQPADAFGHPKLFTPFELFQQLFPNHFEPRA